MSSHAINLYPVLFETLSDRSDEVVIQGLTVLAEIVNSTKSKGENLFASPLKCTLINSISISDGNANHTHYRKFLVRLLKIFEDRRNLLDNRGAFIIR